MPSDTVSFDDFDAVMVSAMNRDSSPIKMEDGPTSIPSQPSRKRARTDNGNEDSDDDDDDTSPQSTAPPASGLTVLAAAAASAPVADAGASNLLAFVHREARLKQIPGDQVKQLEAFAADSHAMKLVKLFMQNLEIMNSLSKIVVATPPFAVSDTLSTNLKEFGIAAMLVPNIANYRNEPTRIVLDVAKTLRFNLPPNIENLPSDWAKVTTAAGYEITQIRASFKKIILKSLEGKAKDHVNIFALTQQLASKAKVTVTIPLCCRVALLRRVHTLDPSLRFWTRVDERLARLRKDAGNDKAKLVKAYKAILKTDMECHGANLPGMDTIPSDEVLNSRQLQVVSVIDGPSPSNEN
ncbi:hypothetical protein OF83DRAFT_1157539 [Amylostereum chailletii]|nr:hypothetical protein OF83DRAFT_1157539 [Amylostereum chailletii]